MTAFFDMGGYGWFVWSAYGMTALVVVAELISLGNRRRRGIAEARRAEPDIPATTRSALDPAGSA